MPETTDLSIRGGTTKLIESRLSDSVGARLLVLRKQYGFSQRELARRAEVTNSTLSMIEQGKVSPSIGSLEKILHAFPVSLQEFFSASLEASPTVLTAEEFIRVERGEAVFRVMPLSMGQQHEGLYLAEQCYPPGARVSSEWMIRNGFIGGIVTSGVLELHLDGVRYCVEAGGGFNFSLHRDHGFLNNGEVECRIVCVSFSD